MSDPNIRIREACPTEIDVLADIGRQTFHETFKEKNNPDDLNKYLEESFTQARIQKEYYTIGSFFFFSEEEGKITGYLKINTGDAQTEYLGEGYLEVERIYVLRKYRGRGTGKKMINKAFELARTFGLDYIWLGVWEHNEPAKTFYRKLGFQTFSEHIFQLGDDPQTDFLLKIKV